LSYKIDKSLIVINFSLFRFRKINGYEIDQRSGDRSTSVSLSTLGINENGFFSDDMDCSGLFSSNESILFETVVDF